MLIFIFLFFFLTILLFYLYYLIDGQKNYFWTKHIPIEYTLEKKRIVSLLIFNFIYKT